VDERRRKVRRPLRAGRCGRFLRKKETLVRETRLRSGSVPSIEGADLNPLMERIRTEFASHYFQDNCRSNRRIRLVRRNARGDAAGQRRNQSLPDTYPFGV